MILQQNWRQLSSIQIGGVICLPVIVIGQALSKTYGFSSAAISIVLGNGILLVLALITATMSIKERKTTIENASLYFGKKGGLLFAGLMVISLLGWFGIQLNLMSIALLELLGLKPQGFPFLASNVMLGILMTLGALRGIKGLNLLSDISVPLMVVTLLYALLMLSEAPFQDEKMPFLEFGGISMVIATAIAAVIDLPTYFRHARSKKDALVGVVLMFGVTIPAVELIGVYLGTFRGNDSVIDLLKGTNPLWNIWIALFIILAGWTTNNTNLYSCSASLEFVWKKTSSYARTWFIGIIGTTLACFDLLEHLGFVLDVLGIGIGSMGSVVLVCYLLNSNGKHPSTLFAWGLGVVMGICSLAGWLVMTSIPILDAFIWSAVGTLLILIKKRKKYAFNRS